MRGTPEALRSSPYDAAFDIALDETLLDPAHPAARVWTPSGRAVVVGIASRIAAELALGRVRAAAVPVRRRFSGGGAVLLTPEVVCFGVVFPYALCGEAKTIGGAYRLATRLVAEALAGLGLRPDFEPPGDLAVKGRKIAGFAQARRRAAALVHGILPVSLDGAELERLLGPPAEEPTYRGGRTHSEFVTDLRRELGSCELGDVEEALARTLGGADAADRGFGPEEIERARGLAEEKYLRDEWNLRR